MALFYHFKHEKQDFDFYNFKKIFKKTKKKIINNLSISSPIRSLLFFLSVIYTSNSYIIFFCDNNTNFRIKQLIFFFENDLSDFIFLIYYK